MGNHLRLAGAEIPIRNPKRQVNIGNQPASCPIHGLMRCGIQFRACPNFADHAFRHDRTRHEGLKQIETLYLSQQDQR